MRGTRYITLIIAISLLTALPYTPFMPIESARHVSEDDAKRDSSFPEMDSDGDGLNDSYEMDLGFDPTQFDTDGDGIPDGAEQEFFEDLAGSGEVPPWLEDLYDPEGDLDGDGIPNYLDDDIDGDGVPDAMEGLEDLNGDGEVDEKDLEFDGDGNGVPDYQEIDRDGNGIPDYQEAMVNPNGIGDSAPVDSFFGLNQQDLTTPLFYIDAQPPLNPTDNPRYWRAAAYDEYNGKQWRTSAGYSEDPGFWHNGDAPYDFSGEVTAEGVTSAEYSYVVAFLTPTRGHLPTALHATTVLVNEVVAMDSEHTFVAEGEFQSYRFTTTEYYYPPSIEEATTGSLPARYTALPSLPERAGPDNDVYDLAASITDNISSDYQKAQALANYLRATYPYDLKAEPTPADGDAVDHFLFTTRKGKCTNFASAFVAMARLNDLPSRFVVGYALGEVQEIEGSDRRVVTQGNAHAWSEVYFEGYGWLTFEATGSSPADDGSLTGANSTGEDDTVQGNGTNPGTENTQVDTDGDGLNDDYENTLGTDPENEDTDGDGLWDGVETNTGVYVGMDDTGTSPLTNDTDGDGLSDPDELSGQLRAQGMFLFWSDPNDADYDDDGLTDGEEYAGFDFHGTTVCTLPHYSDTDDDGLNDGLEVGLNVSHAPAYTAFTWQPDADPATTTHPLIADTDGDGIDDGSEDFNQDGRIAPGSWLGLGVGGGGETNPNAWDTDNGTRSDYQEIFLDFTDPLDYFEEDRDLDGDNLSDLVETNTTVFIDEEDTGTDPYNPDSDGDGMPDGWEVEHGLDPTINDAAGDPDDDGLTNKQEYINGGQRSLHPNDDDSDGDGLDDGWEYARRGEALPFDPLIRDLNGNGASDGLDDYDGDGLGNAKELYQYETLWNGTDSDGDGLWDGDELKPNQIARDGFTNQRRYDSDPLLVDSDGDGLNDTQEVEPSNDTYHSITDPMRVDTDTDGLNDTYEIQMWWNVTGNDTDPRRFWDVEGWETSDPNERDTDEDELVDGEDDNPVMLYVEETEDPEFQFSKGRGEPLVNPANVTKEERFIRTGLLRNADTKEPYVGLTVVVWLNRTIDVAGTLIGAGVTDASGQFNASCRVSDDAESGEWVLRLALNRTIYNGSVVRAIMSAPFALGVNGSSFFAVDFPAKVPAGGSTAVAGSLYEQGGLPLKAREILLEWWDNDTWTLQGSDTTTTGNDGSFAFTLDMPGVGGYYAVNLSWVGDPYLNASRTNGSFEAIASELNLSATFPTALTVDQPFRVNGTMQGNVTVPPTGSILLKLGGSTLASLPAANGDYAFDLATPSSAVPGNSTLSVSYSGDLFHPATVRSIPITVRGWSVTTLNNPTVERGNSVNLQGTLKDNRGDPVVGATVVLTWDGAPLANVTTRGDGSFNHSFAVLTDPVGFHAVEADFAGNTAVDGSNASATVTVEADTFLTVNDADVARGENFTFRGWLHDDLGKPVEGASLEVTWNGESLPSPVTTANGSFIVEKLIEPHVVAPFTVEVTYPGGEFLHSAYATATLVPHAHTVLALEVNSLHRGGNLTIEVLLRDALGFLVKQANVSFSIADSPSLPANFNATTGDDGRLNRTLWVAAEHPVGIFGLTAQFNGSATYFASEATANFTITGSSRLVNLTMVNADDPIEIVRGTDFVVTGRLTDENGLPLNGTVVVKLDSKLLNVIFETNGSFRANGTVPSHYRDEHDLSFSFAGDDYHDGASGQREIHVLIPTQLQLMASPTLVHPGEQVRVTGTLVEDDGSPVVGKTVYLTVTFTTNDNLTLPDENFAFVTNSLGQGGGNFTFPDGATGAQLAGSFGGGGSFTNTTADVAVTLAPPVVPATDYSEYLSITAVIGVALLVCLIYLYWLQRHKFEVRNLVRRMQRDLNDEADYRRIIIQAYEQFTRILMRYEFLKHPAQTAREFKAVVSRALPISPVGIDLMTSLFELARYSDSQPSTVDDTGMVWQDGSYYLWCAEAINTLHGIEEELQASINRSLFGRLFSRGKPS